MEKTLKEILRTLKAIEKKLGRLEESLFYDLEDQIEVISDSEFEKECEEILPDAVFLIKDMEKVSLKYMQRKLKIGYVQLIRIIESLSSLEIMQKKSKKDIIFIDKKKAENYLKKTGYKLDYQNKRKKQKGWN